MRAADAVGRRLAGAIVPARSASAFASASALSAVVPIDAHTAASADAPLLPRAGTTAAAIALCFSVSDAVAPWLGLG